MYNYDEIYTTYIISAVSDGKHIECKPPKYFDYLLEKEFPQYLELLEQHKKNEQKKAINSIDLALEETDKEYLAYLKTLELIFEYKTELVCERSDN